MIINGMQISINHYERRHKKREEDRERGKNSVEEHVSGNPEALAISRFFVSASGVRAGAGRSLPIQPGQ